MNRKFMMVLFAGAVCLLGVTSALAYNEAPMLRAKVAAGELPPIQERLPVEPAVMEPEEEIGQYGGTLHVLAENNLPWNDMTTECGATLLRVLPDGSAIVGNIAKGYELSEDGKGITLYLREGLKWSDGAPFTADDIVFTFEDLHWNKDVTGVWNRLPMYTRIKKIDDYTLRLEGDQSYYIAVSLLAPAEGIGWRFFKPKHYLKKWHIKYNPDANELAKKEGFENWPQVLFYHMNWAPQGDLDLPTLAPWVLKESTSTMKVLERNPYYWKVDTAGNQLPYIDGVISFIVDSEVAHMKIISGEADIASLCTEISNYPLYKENEKQGNYGVRLLESATANEVAFSLNLNDPDLALRKIYQDVRFRRALSLAINREEINDSIFFGLCTPRQATTLPTASFYKKEWGEAYAQYDPNGARRLLDEVGLTERDKDDFRIGPDGKPLLLMIEYSELDMPTGCLELVKEYWEAVGIKVFLKPEEFSLWRTRMRSNEHGVSCVGIDDQNEASIWSYKAIINWSRGGAHVMSYAWNWGLWLNAEEEVKVGRKTLEDFEGGKLPGEEPPAYVKELNRWVDEWTQVRYGSEEYKKIAQKIFDFHAENLFIIGTVGLGPWVYVVKNDVGNAPTKRWAGMSWTGSLNMVGEQLFFKR